MRATVRDTGFSAVSSVCGHISVCVCVHIGEKERGRLREGVLLWGIGIRVRMRGRTQGMEEGMDVVQRGVISWDGEVISGFYGQRE